MSININEILEDRDTVYPMIMGIMTVRKPITCADGFRFSVQASSGHYCTPRDDIGPWIEFEVGYPSEREETLMPFAEDGDNPTETVYGWVPAEVIEAIIEKHGGIV